jgi:hypothetical protein
VSVPIVAPPLASDRLTSCPATPVTVNTAKG